MFETLKHFLVSWMLWDASSASLGLIRFEALPEPDAIAAPLQKAIFQSL
jgi:hypothetical protein